MKDTIKKPEIVVFAGPNGSGKSTFTEFLKPPIDYINADEIKKNIECTDLEAAKLADHLREEHITNRTEFCFETVLSTPRNLLLMQNAKENGYFIRCYYIITIDPAINIARVASRVHEGGHDVPVDKIVERYYRALKLLKDVVAVCDICHIYDNSHPEPFRIFKKRKNIYYYEESTDWHREDIEQLTGIHNINPASLNKIQQ